VLINKDARNSLALFVLRRTDAYSDRWRVTKFIAAKQLSHSLFIIKRAEDARRPLLIIPAAFHLKNKLSALSALNSDNVYFSSAAAAATADETFLRM
jgi:hypothetical protein